MSRPASPFDPGHGQRPVERLEVDGVLFLRTAPTLRSDGILDGLVEMVHGWAESGGAGAPIHVVIDLSATGLEVSGHELRQSALRIHQLNTRGRLAICVESDFQFGLGRMFGILCDGSGLDVYPFRDQQAAFQWVRRDIEPVIW
jgi:hypothetical protein